MRKYIRKMMKYAAEHKGVKASKFIKNKFEKMQIKKYGAYRRDLNIQKGTHPRKTWKNRCAIVLFTDGKGKRGLNEKAGT